MLRIVFVALAASIAITGSAIANCTATGVSAKDRAVANKFCAVYPSGKAFTSFHVEESLMHVETTRAMLEEMNADRIGTKKIADTMVRGFKQESGLSVVTIYLYLDGTKMIEFDTTLTGEVKVKFLF